MKKQLFTFIISVFTGITLNAQSWAILGSGVNAQVTEISSYGSDIYAGGYFSTAGGNSASHIAKWNGASWSPMGNGTNDIITAMIEFNGELYVSGDFTTAGGVPANHIAKWNGTSWSSVGTTGLDNAAYSFAIFNNQLYAGGLFTTADGITVNKVAKWTGTTWSALGTGFTGLDDLVQTFTVFNNELYAGGNFGGSPGVVKLSGTSWNSVGTGMTGSSSMFVYSLAVYNNKLYAGGEFFIGGSMSGTAFAILTGSTWLNAGSPEVGPVYALAVYKTELYLAGNIAGVIGSNIVNNIKKWDGSAFSFVPGVNDYITALYTTNNILYAGGYFTSAFGTPANHIAKFTNPVGIEEHAKQIDLKLYPNPFDTQTTIDFAEEQTSTSVRIYDVLGNTIKIIHFSSKQLIIKKEEMTSGIYFLQITDENKNTSTRKIIIQ